MSLLEFVGLAAVAYAAGMLSLNLTSIILVKLCLPQGHARVVVNAELFRMIWSWGFNRPGIHAVVVIAALAIGGVCMACATVLGGFAVAAAIAAALGFIAMLVMFFVL